MKKETVIGIIGYTQGVKIPPRPASNESRKSPTMIAPVLKILIAVPVYPMRFLLLTALQFLMTYQQLFSVIPD